MPLDRTSIEGNADLWRIAPGEVGVREMLLGVVVVGVLAGLTVGRHTERIRRNYKDYVGAKAAVPKAKDLHRNTVKSAMGKFVIWGAIALFAIVVFLNLPSSRT
jgi:hypothetical protein